MLLKLEDLIEKTVNKIHALVDSGSAITILNQRTVDENEYPTERVRSWERYRIRNADGSHNKAGRIEDAATLEFTIPDERGNEMRFKERFLVTDIGDIDVILGIDWLKKWNPKIDWTGGRIWMDEEEADGYWQDAKEGDESVEVR